MPSGGLEKSHRSEISRSPQNHTMTDEALPLYADDESYDWNAGQKVAQVLLRLTAFFSLLATLCPLLESIADERAGQGTPVSRVILSATIGFCSASIVYIVGTWAIPVEAPEGSWLASGNNTTCNVQGFFAVWANIFLLSWDIVLSIFFVLIVCYNWSNSRLAKLERVLHPVIWVSTVALSAAAWATGSLNPSTDYCWLASAPEECGDDDALMECIRGKHAHIFVLVFYLHLIGAIVVSVTSMALIFRSIRLAESRNRKYIFRSNIGTSARTIESTVSSKTKVSKEMRREESRSAKSAAMAMHKKSREVAVQGLLYASTVVVSVPVMITSCMWIFSGVWNEAVGQTAMIVSASHGFWYLASFLRRRQQMRTNYGRMVRRVVDRCCSGHWLQRVSAKSADQSTDNLGEQKDTNGDDGDADGSEDLCRSAEESVQMMVEINEEQAATRNFNISILSEEEAYR